MADVSAIDERADFNGVAPNGAEPEESPGGLKVWLSASRPATLLACVVPVMVGSALAAADDALRWDVVLVALASAGMIQIGTNFYNDYADFERGADTEERLGPARATQKGWLTPSQVWWGAMGAFALAVALGVYLVMLAGWPVVVIGVLSVLSGIAYTGGPMPLAYHGLGDVFVWIFFGLVAVCGTYYIQVGDVTAPVIWSANAVGALASAILVVNNLRDRVTDVKANKRTLAVRFGATAARVQYTVMVLFAYVVPVVVWSLGLGGFGWLLPLLTAPLAIAETRAIWTRDGRALNPHLGGTARLEMVYGVLLSVGVLL